MCTLMDAAKTICCFASSAHAHSKYLYKNIRVLLYYCTLHYLSLHYRRKFNCRNHSVSSSIRAFVWSRRLWVINKLPERTEKCLLAPSWNILVKNQKVNCERFSNFGRFCGQILQTCPQTASVSDICPPDSLGYSPLLMRTSAAATVPTILQCF